MRIAFRLILCSTLCIGVLASCKTSVTHYPSASKEELDKERKIQQNMLAEAKIEKKERAERNRLKMQQRLLRVAKRIRKAGVALCKNTDKPVNKCVYDYELMDEGQPLNAYADGKTIYVTPAMMRFAKKDDELAVVLGHEYAHNVMEHRTAKRTNEIVGNAIGFALDMLASYNGISTGGQLTNLGAEAANAAYSQNFEKEADYVGLYITSLAGYNITYAPKFWRRMSMVNEDAIMEASTHPSNPERFVGLSKVVKEVTDKRSKGQKLAPELKE